MARACAAGVQALLIPGIAPAWWPRQVAVRDAHPEHGIALAIGVHPQVVPDLTAVEAALAQDPERLVAEIVRHHGIAVGECGLDGGTDNKSLQEAIFRAHVRAARLLGQPLVVHVLRAHDLAPRILREERAAEVGGVLHSYSGGADLVPVYRDLGMCFSFAGPISYRGSRRPVEAARAIPDELLLAETDAPDQAPEGHRGSRSEPAYVAQVVAGLAAARGVPEADMAALTTANARRLFRAL